MKPRSKKKTMQTSLALEMQLKNGCRILGQDANFVHTCNANVSPRIIPMWSLWKQTTRESVFNHAQQREPG